MSSILSFSFFITKQMKTDLRAGELIGTLPILYVFLARSGKTIRDVSPDRPGRNRRGAFGERNAAARTPTRGVRIKFAGSDGVEKTLYFFSTDLSNSSVANQRISEILPDARARQQPDQECVVPALCRQFFGGAGIPAQQQRNHHPG